MKGWRQTAVGGGGGGGNGSRGGRGVNGGDGGGVNGGGSRGGGDGGDKETPPIRVHIPLYPVTHRKAFMNVYSPRPAISVRQ